MTDNAAAATPFGPPQSADDVAAVKQAHEARDAIMTQVQKRIVGQHDVVEKMLVALFARGHCLLMGVPGLAKTLLVSTVAEALHLKFSRIQFTPDLMPSDITGTDILEEERASGRRTFKFIKGPVFANLLLADEINRTPPKTQAALLQAMQEGHVTAAGQTYPLDPPFLVFATQNPIEQEGTYPLPEAQLDRFMFMVRVDYPSEAEEVEVVDQTTGDLLAPIEAVLDPAQILAHQALVRRVPASQHVISYAVRLVRASRPTDDSAPDFVKEFVSWGAGPRASQYLILAGKARAMLDGRFTVSTEDVRALAPSVLTHRVLTNFHAEAQGVDSLEVCARLLEQVTPP